MEQNARCNFHPLYRSQVCRLPHGARLAWEENACLVVLGTGASEKDGVLEGR